ncbi:hypothetical protein [Parvularcula oceani]|uniref:hypothetical protein n=1 Tax=Parvularcula oceani TaxID=1247963 RepID=UPI0004E12BDA|nr:hypothetical protein [Parvularcula oceani]
MRRALLLSTFLPAFLLATPAHAECEEDGSAIVCTGTDTDGFETDADGAILSVVPAATVSAEEDAVVLEGMDSRVENQGLIEAGEDGVVLGAGGTLVNDGTITAADDAVDGDELDDITVVNFGAIEGGDGDGNRGVVLGTGNRGTLENYGSITAYDEVFEAGDDALVTNEEGALIASGGEDGVQVQLNGDIANYGTIYGGLINGDGIDIDSGTIFNAQSGLIESRARGLTATEDGAEAGIDVDEGEGSVEIVNDGTIRGEIGILEDRGNTGGHVVSNAGLIAGTGGIGIDFDRGDDIVDLLSGGTIEGDVLLGEGSDMFAIEGGAVMDGSVSLGAGDDDVYLDGLFGAFVGGTESTLFDGGEGEDLIGFDLATTLGDIVGIAMSEAFADATELTFRNTDGSTSIIVFTGFELFDIEGELYSLNELAEAIPLPGALPLFASALGLGGLLRRRARRS